MSTVFRPSATRAKDSDFVGRHELDAALRRELICGDCCEDRPARLPEDESPGTTTDGEPVDRAEWT